MNQTSFALRTRAFLKRKTVGKNLTTAQIVTPRRFVRTIAIVGNFPQFLSWSSVSDCYMSLAYMLKLKTDNWEQLYNHHLEKLCLQAHSINKTLKARALPTLDEFSDLSEAGMDDYLKELLEDNLEEFGITTTKDKTNWHELNKALAYFTRVRESIRHEELPDKPMILQEIGFILDSLNESNATHAALMLKP